jgi:hypothetical protein
MVVGRRQWRVWKKAETFAICKGDAFEEQSIAQDFLSECIALHVILL